MFTIEIFIGDQGSDRKNERAAKLQREPATPNTTVEIDLDSLPYYRKEWFFTRDETRFFKALHRAVHSTHLVMSKVRLWDLIDVPKKHANWQTFTNKIGRKHVDFVLVGRKSLQVDLIIELDGPSHQSKRQIENDEFQDAALISAGLPFLRMQTASDYNPDDIQEKVLAQLRR